MMEHATEEELIGYRGGERMNRQQISMHLAECDECREQLARIEQVFSALNAMPVPDPGEDYERRVWQQISPRLPEKPAGSGWWEALFAPRHLAAVGALVAVIVAAFLLGRISNHGRPGATVVDAVKVRERVLFVAVGDHLGRSEMVLMELENAQPVQSGQRVVNISATQRRAESLLDENRLYRQTALHEGDQAMASTLDELERVLLDIANSPDTVTSAQFESLRKRIEDRGILFKVRVVNQDLQERNKPAKQKPAQDNSSKKERNKA
jgi:hypothetical protein